jgi:CheY-like chemotaxis protein
VPVERARFGELVQDALAHLFDYGYLQSHPLVDLLLSAERPSSPGRALHALLREAMDGLRPPRETPSQARAWRAYRCLQLRYQEMLPMAQVADELGISARQCRRAHHEALEAAGTLLWHRAAPGPAIAIGRPAEAADQALGAGPTLDPPDPVGPGSLLEQEAARLSREAGEAAIDLAESVRAVVQMLEPLARAQGARLAAAVPAGLPPVAMNRIALRQTLLAALHHAIAWAGAGDVVLAAGEPGQPSSASPEARPGEADVALTVRARRGPGAGGEESAHLTVARQLIEAAGGALTVGASADALALRLALPARHPPTALIVDDNPDALRLARRYLAAPAAGHPGYRVLVAGDGREALRLAEEARPDVIALDVMMPDQDGWEVLQTLRSHPRTAAIPVVVCSVLPERELALMLGAIDFLPKPFSQRELLDALERVRRPGAASRGG